MSLRISVVMAVYNGEFYLKRAIESVLRQTYPAHELIVIDDGSADGTPDILRSYGSRVITRRFANSGVAATMNRGLALATGDAVAFLDHDDVWFKDKLEKQAEALTRYPETGFVCCNYVVRPTGGRMIKHYPTMSSLKDLDPADPAIKDPLRALIQENFVGTSSAVLLRRRVTQEVGGFNERYRITGDYDYWLRCTPVTGFVALPDVLFYKQTHKANLSADSVRTLTEQRDIMVNFFENRRDLFEKGRLAGTYQRNLAKLHFTIGNLYFEKKKKKDAFLFYWRALCARRSAANVFRYLWTVTKKSLRVLTFDILSRKTLQRVGGGE